MPLSPGLRCSSALPCAIDNPQDYTVDAGPLLKWLIGTDGCKSCDEVVKARPTLKCFLIAIWDSSPGTLLTSS